MDDANDDITAAHKRYEYVLDRLGSLSESGSITYEQYEKARAQALNERNAVLDFHGVQHVE